jgi:hypothetical protein
MADALDGQAVKRWLSDQRAAGERIAQERIQALFALTPERSLEHYLELSESVPVRLASRPSPLLWALRRALAAMSARGGA